MSFYRSLTSVTALSFYILIQNGVYIAGDVQAIQMYAGIELRVLKMVSWDKARRTKDGHYVKIYPGTKSSIQARQ